MIAVLAARSGYNKTMYKPSKPLLVLIVLVVIALVFGFAYYYRTPKPDAGGVAADGTSLTAVADPNGADSGQDGNSPSGVAQSVGTAVGGFNVLTPASGDSWLFGQKHLVTWNKEGGVDGSLALIDLKTDATVGYVLPHIGSHQVSYSWDTRYVYANRVGPDKKEVANGSYRIRLKYDGPYLRADSAPFSVVAGASAEITTESVSIRDKAFSIKSLTVKRGTRVVFINNDKTTYTFGVETLADRSLVAGASYMLDTQLLSPGAYEYHLKFPSNTIRGLLIVQ